LQGEIRGFDEVIDCIKNLEKYELKEDKLQIEERGEIKCPWWMDKKSEEKKIEEKKDAF